MRRILGPYVLEQEIGRGGVGVVYRARAPQGDAVAIKVLLAREPERLARFDRERRLLASLGEAEGFVPLRDAGSDQGDPYLVMPLVPGGNLRARLSRGPLDPEAARVLGEALARAVGHAYARGIVHRDLKPENVLFDAAGRPLVADLGLAKHFRGDAPGASQSLALSRGGAFLGTVGWMPPEQLHDPSGVGPAADVFALGAILYECLGGRAPFEGENPIETIAAIERCRPEPLERRRPGLPRSLVAVVERCLAGDPRDRFEDGAALAAALAVETVSARSSTRRVTRLAAAGLALLVLALGGGVLAAARARSARTQEAAACARRALESLDRGELAAALSGAAEAIALDPTVARAWTARGEAFLRKDDRREAAAALARTLELDPDDARAHRGRASLRRSDGQLAGAVQDLDRAIELDPRDARALAERARVRNALGEHERALADATRALALDAGLAEAFASRGEARFRRGDRDGGRADLDRAIGLAPRIGWLRDARARLMGTIPEQLADETRAVELEPGVASFWANLAGHRINSGDVEGAIAAATRAIEIDPACAWGYGRRGDGWLLRHEPEKARQDLDRAIELLPTEYWFVYYRASARLELGDTAGAIEDCDRAVKIEPRCYGTVFITRAAAHLQRQERDLARADLERALAAELDAGSRAQVEKALASLGAERR